jgi:hypothetical protein
MLSDEAQRDRDLGQEQDRKSFEDTGHIFYVLSAIGRYRVDEELPSWVRQWLLEFTREVLPAFLHHPATVTRPATGKYRATIDRPEYIPTLDEVRKRVLDAARPQQDCRAASAHNRRCHGHDDRLRRPCGRLRQILEREGGPDQSSSTPRPQTQAGPDQKPSAPCQQAQADQARLAHLCSPP